jgi:hypothetical protein
MRNLGRICGVLSLDRWIGIGYGVAWLCAGPSRGEVTSKLMDTQPALESESMTTDGAWHEWRSVKQHVWPSIAPWSFSGTGNVCARGSNRSCRSGLTWPAISTSIASQTSLTNARGTRDRIALKLIRTESEGPSGTRVLNS